MKKFTKTMRNTDIIAMLEALAVNSGSIKFNTPNGSTIADCIDHLNHENELLAKKNSSDAKKPTKAQQENEVFKASILNFLSHCVGPVTATEVMNGCSLGSNQKTAALLRSLKGDGKVEKEIIKGKPFFRLA